MNEITPGCFNYKPSNFQDVSGTQRGLGITYYRCYIRNLTLKMSSLRIMFKRSRGKKQQKETEKQENVFVTENNLFKGLAIKRVRNYDRK